MFLTGLSFVPAVPHGTVGVAKVAKINALVHQHIPLGVHAHAGGVKIYRDPPHVPAHANSDESAFFYMQQIAATHVGNPAYGRLDLYVKLPLAPAIFWYYT